MNSPDGRDRIIRIMLAEATNDVVVITPARLARKIEQLSKGQKGIIPKEFIEQYNGRALTVWSWHRLRDVQANGIPGWAVSEIDDRSTYAVEFRRLSD